MAVIESASSDSDSSVDERSPAELVAELLAHCNGATVSPDASDSQSALRQWDAQRDTVAELYSCNLHGEGRAQLAALPYVTHWRPLVRHCVTLLPLVADVGAAAASDRSLAAALALAVTRLLVVMRNLCPTPSFQRQVRADMIDFLAEGSAPLHHCATAMRALERAVAHDSCIKEPRLLLKSLLQLWANMLTPNGGRASDNGGGSDADASDGAWLWVQTALYPSVLAPLLRLHRDLPDLSSIGTAIVHHALLCDDADTSYAADLRAPTRAAVTAMMTTTAGAGSGLCLFPQLLDATVHLVESQLQSVYDDEEDGPSKAPLSVWDWKPHEREPAWLVHVVDLAMRACPDFIQSLQSQLSAQQWCMLLRLVEVWSESLQQNEDLTMELRRMQVAAADPEHATAAAAQQPQQQRSLASTAESVASNTASLVQWLQQRPHLPLPVVVLPPSKPSATAAVDSSADAGATAEAASAASSSAASSTAAAVPPVATSSIPLDSVTNSVLHTLGHVLLFDLWNGTPLFESLRDALAAQGCAPLLLQLLSAADTLDGGAMFSDLYRPAGHTRHTKSSEDPQAYVNQFRGRDGAPAAAAASAGSTVPSSSAPTAPSARQTPYMLKSNLLRLVASLSFRSRAWQDAFGADGVYACMNHSVLDEHNPLMREYAILALRNLLEQHEANQAVVAELRVDAIANQDNLHQLGVNTEIDEATGKIRIASQANRSSDEKSGDSSSSSSSSS